MTLGDKLAKLRKEHNYTQEQLAALLGVSRQAISKWEADASYPETEKLLKLGTLYNCSMDYLLKDGAEEPFTGQGGMRYHIALPAFERKSRRTICGLPLWHVNIGYGRTAKGIVAIGLSARGIVSVGLVSVGVFSFGLLALGVFALGVLALGLLPAGAIAFGVLAFGAVSVGLVSVGALSIGEFSIGAMSIGNYFALGDHAEALIALGDTRATGELYQKLGELTVEERAFVKQLLDEIVPAYFGWAKELAKLFL